MTTAGIHPNTLSKLVSGYLRTRENDPRICAVGRELGLAAAECFEAVADEQPTRPSRRPERAPAWPMALFEVLAPLPRTMVGLALLSGVRRGELFALRWRNADEVGRVIHIREAVYEGTFGTPKTEASRRTIPLFDGALELIDEWRRQTQTTGGDQLVFATRSGKPISPNNVLRRWVYPACVALGVPKASWLVLRRTYSTWAHGKNVPTKIMAQVRGHAKVDTTLNVYRQALEGSVRATVESVGAESFGIVQSPVGPTALIH